MAAQRRDTIMAALFAVLVFCLGGATAGLSEERIIMVTEEWPPFRLNDAASPWGFRGIDIDLVRALSAETGIGIEVQRHPWARALELMRSGQADMITGVARTAEREQFMHYIPVSYCAVHPVLYTQAGRGGQFRSYQDLFGPSVGYSLHSAYFQPFDSDARINKVGLSTEVQMLQVLALKRLDVIIGTDPNISFDIARLGLRDQVEPTHYQPPDSTALFIALSRKSQAMRHAAAIENALQRLVASGAVEKIVHAYR